MSHPYHIHVNPFQIVAIYDPDGNDVSGPDAEDDYDVKHGLATAPDPEYPGLRGVWKDTIWIKNSAKNPTDYPLGSYTVVAYTRYERYPGKFVLHCHILDHEDLGMMGVIEVRQART